jgi:hypothetical protein
MNIVFSNFDSAACTFLKGFPCTLPSKMTQERKMKTSDEASMIIMLGVTSKETVLAHTYSLLLRILAGAGRFVGWNIVLERCCGNVIIRGHIDDFVKTIIRKNR